jgi:hypothetical protein
MGAGAALCFVLGVSTGRGHWEQGHGDPDTGTPRPPGYVSDDPVAKGKASNFDAVLSARVSRGIEARMRPLLVCGTRTPATHGARPEVGTALILLMQCWHVLMYYS